MRISKKISLFASLALCLVMVFGMTASAADVANRVVAGSQVTGRSFIGDYYGKGTTTYPRAASLTVDVDYQYIYGTGTGTAELVHAYSGDRTTSVSATASAKSEHIMIRNTSVSCKHYIYIDGQSATFYTNK